MMLTDFELWVELSMLMNLVYLPFSCFLRMKVGPAGLLFDENPIGELWILSANCEGSVSLVWVTLTLWGTGLKLVWRIVGLLSC